VSLTGERHGSSEIALLDWRGVEPASRAAGFHSPRRSQEYSNRAEAGALRAFAGIFYGGNDENEFAPLGDSHGASVSGERAEWFVANDMSQPARRRRAHLHDARVIEQPTIGDGSATISAAARRTLAGSARSHTTTRRAGLFLLCSHDEYSVESYSCASLSP